MRFTSLPYFLTLTITGALPSLSLLLDVDDDGGGVPHAGGHVAEFEIVEVGEVRREGGHPAGAGASEVRESTQVITVSGVTEESVSRRAVGDSGDELGTLDAIEPRDTGRTSLMVNPRILFGEPEFGADVVRL